VQGDKQGKVCPDNVLYIPAKVSILGSDGFHNRHNYLPKLLLQSSGGEQGH
jgi:hypothetical protein